jgi:NAD(P)H dehydrogenase (quinone)
MINIMCAGGRLGLRVTQCLLNQGAAPNNLIASLRTPDKVKHLAELGVTVRHADYDDPDSLRSAYQGTEVLFLIPSSAPVEPRVRQHYNALEAAKQAGIKRIIFASSAPAGFLDSRFVITPFLLYAESRLRLSGLAWTILRNGMYLDPIAEWAPRLAKMGRLPHPVQAGRVAYVPRNDLARASAAACLKTGHAGKVYELTGPEALSMPDLAGIISRATGQPIQSDSLTEAGYAELCCEHLPDGLIGVMISLYRAVDNREYEKVTDHIEQITGNPPETAESYLRRTVSLQMAKL